MSRCVLNEFELKSQTNNYTFTHGLAQGTTHSLALRGKQKRSERNYEKTNHELSFCFLFFGQCSWTNNMLFGVDTLIPV